MTPESRHPVLPVPRDVVLVHVPNSSFTLSRELVLFSHFIFNNKYTWGGIEFWGGMVVWRPMASEIQTDAAPPSPRNT